MRIAVDAMGGDKGPRATVAGAASAVIEDPQIDIQLFGPRALLEDEISRLPRPLVAAASHLHLCDAPDVIAADMRASQALRSGGRSSMARMLESVAAGDAAVGVSPGNTGALMALSRRALGMVPGVPRPAISTAIPTRDDGRCYLLDLGANVDVSAERLVDFALMGDIMARHVDGLVAPRIALLNVGVESTKGSAVVQDADAMLRQLPGLNYLGFIEGDGVFAGEADVVVCDGFVGNVLLKASEGLAKMLVRRVQATFEAHWGSRLVGLLARPALKRLKSELDPVRYNGASLLGLAGIVIKSHGSCDAQGFHYALRRASQEVRRDLPSRLHAELDHRRLARTRTR
ncbi:MULTISPECIES: phosphate acyltransferase PlsX [Halomonas]|uniref:phosphate acyltransferase PlsX n=1 Tax=Halomonas TaxID=2745 RepID=UPI001C962024|nr:MULTISPECIES: phosphate acyltransferase PlsX [Halomonas]MBY5925567.1 phosphate acyltransferase PlsX [Halomonas sp. DP4Y7-2]MBY5969394.1 phosphate acyltransferase PlsX [Halomonas denitrificans]MBY6030708.1 phosphate acyltransferase PlsX [Halomonas sp. DP8Y7-1]MBY6208080.1 phosphate acyltransferase PlsX [Halomonas sp. DP3Y7-2]MBY6228889.1 phosphate acyltransferase PlsX [Halomonas sp. DP3Y7-1]